MPTAVQLVRMLPSHLLRVVHDGNAREVSGMEFVDTELESVAHPGDLLLAVSPAPDLPERLRDLADNAGPPAAGIVVRRSALTDELADACAHLSLTTVTLTDGVSWTLASGMLQSAIEEARRPDDNSSLDDLFALAEQIEEVIDAPVTIEDADSRVLAYSGRQDDTDQARVSTIIGRRVPREVRAHFRAHGVFRRLATSDAPFLVDGFADHEATAWVRPRFVVPVRAGGTWLGSIWAVRDDPVTGERLTALLGAADVVALHLLRLRSRRELSRQISVEQVRAVLRGEATDASLPTAPWRVVMLLGPVGNTSAEARRELWHAQLRRHGWAVPMVADLGDDVLTVVTAEGDSPGSWTWLRGVALRAGRPGAPVVTASPVVTALADVPNARHLAAEQATLASAPATTTADLWPLLTVRRAVACLDGLPDPLSPLREHDSQQGTDLRRSLEAVLDHWAEPRRSATRLGVHVNTVRYRLSQIRGLLGDDVDLDDPLVRVALHVWCRAEPGTRPDQSS